MTTDTPPPPRHDKRRENIVEEAIRQFNQNGFADTRLEDIGERLKTAKTSISYHFKSKEGLLLEVYDRALRFSEQAMERAADQPTGRDALLYWIRAHAKAHADALSGIAQPLALIADLPDIKNKQMSGVIDRHHALVSSCRQLLQRGQADGSVGVTSVDATLFFLLNILHWMPRWLTDVRVADYEIAIESLISVLVEGIAADPIRDPAPSIIQGSMQDVSSVFDRESRNRMKREAFLRTGTRALNTSGFRSLSLSDVAGELGVTRGAFYYHIADKDALLLGCFERSFQIIETAQRLGGTDTHSGLDVLERSLRWLFERQASNLDPLIRLSLVSALSDKHRTLVQTKLNRVKSDFAEMIARGIVDDSINPHSLPAAEQLIIGSVFAASRRRLQVIRTKEDESISTPGFGPNAYFETLFYGLKGAAHEK